MTITKKYLLIMGLRNAIPEIDDASRQAASVLLCVDLQKTFYYCLHLTDVLLSMTLDMDGGRIIHPIWVETRHHLECSKSNPRKKKFQEYR